MTESQCEKAMKLHSTIKELEQAIKELDKNGTFELRRTAIEERERFGQIDIFYETGLVKFSSQPVKKCFQDSLKKLLDEKKIELSEV